MVDSNDNPNKHSDSDYDPHYDPNPDSDFVDSFDDEILDGLDLSAAPLALSEKDDNLDVELVIEKMKHHIVRTLRFGTVYIFLVSLVTLAFANVSVLTHYDVLYFPPILVYTLDRYLGWMVYGIFQFSVVVYVFIITAVYRRRSTTKALERGMHLAIVGEILFVPVGLVCGLIALGEMKSLKRQQESGEFNEIRYPRNVMITNTGMITIYAAVIHLGLMFLIYLLTMYLSLVMLDITFPFLVMDTIDSIRNILYVIISLFLVQIIYGGFILKQKRNGLMKFMTLFFIILQLPLFPMGTFAASTLIKYNKYVQSENIKQWKG